LKTGKTSQKVFQCICFADGDHAVLFKFRKSLTYLYKPEVPEEVVGVLEKQSFMEKLEPIYCTDGALDLLIEYVGCVTMKRLTYLDMCILV